MEAMIAWAALAVAIIGVGILVSVVVEKWILRRVGKKYEQLLKETENIKAEEE